MKLILVVEDEYGNAEILQLLMEAEGYRVVLAANGQAALDQLKEELPDLILSDYMMPTMNGAELGHAVRRDPAMAHIPIIFVSATSEDVVAQAFADYDAFLHKPFDVETLLPTVARLIASGRVARPSSDEVDESMRHLLKGIHLPPGD